MAVWVASLYSQQGHPRQHWPLFFWKQSLEAHLHDYEPYNLKTVVQNWSTMTWFCASGPRPEKSTILRAEVNFGHVGLKKLFLWQHWPREEHKTTQDPNIPSGTAPRIGSTTLSATNVSKPLFLFHLFVKWYHLFNMFAVWCLFRKNCQSNHRQVESWNMCLLHLPTTGAAAGTNLDVILPTNDTCDTCFGEKKRKVPN